MDKLRKWFHVWRARRELRRSVLGELDRCARIYNVQRQRFEGQRAFKRRVIKAVLEHFDRCVAP